MFPSKLWAIPTCIGHERGALLGFITVPVDDWNSVNIIFFDVVRKRYICIFDWMITEGPHGAVGSYIGYRSVPVAPPTLRRGGKDYERLSICSSHGGVRSTNGAVALRGMDAKQREPEAESRPRSFRTQVLPSSM